MYKKLSKEEIEQFESLVTRKKCEAYLRAMLNNIELERTWWSQENEGFQGRCPEDVFKESPYTVLQYLMFCSI